MNILSLDGGGVHAVHTAVILARIEAALPGTIAKADMIAGTSAGGMIALFLAAGHQPSEVLTIYANAAALFTRSLERRAEAEIGICAKYDSIGRQAVLTQYLGTKQLKDLGKYVLIQSFQLGTKPAWQSKVFHNIPSSTVSAIPDSLGMLAVDAAMATSAAPYYFPSYQGCIDGGVACNHPAMTALAMTQDDNLTWPFKDADPDTISLFSIGRTYGGDRIDTSGGEFDAGWVQWLPKIVSLLLTAGQSVVDYQASNFLGDAYFRHTGNVPSDIDCAIDDTTGIPALQAWANGLDLTAEIAWFKANWS